MNGILFDINSERTVFVATDAHKLSKYTRKDIVCEQEAKFIVPSSKTRRGRVGKKVSQTLDTQCNQGVFTKQRIRRLTPTECFRLMDFNQEMIEKTINSKLISDSQLYKQAGNSICVGVLAEIIKKINQKKKN